MVKTHCFRIFFLVSFGFILGWILAVVTIFDATCKYQKFTKVGSILIRNNSKSKDEFFPNSFNSINKATSNMEYDSLNDSQHSQKKTESLNSLQLKTTRKVNLLNNLQLFSFHGKSWIKETALNANRNEFLKANLISKYGTTPIYIHNPKDDIHVSRSVLNTGSWENHLINLLLDLLNQNRQHQFIDLGANIGVYSLSVAKFNRRVIAVEPLWKNVHRLGASIIDGQLTNLIQLVRSPLSDVYENVSFASENKNIGGTFVIRDNSVTSGVNFTVVSDNVVETARLDDFLNLPNFDFKSVVMKIDVEGSEERTLRGGEEFFRRVDVVAVLMEWMHHKQDGQPIVDFMTRHGMYATIPTDFSKHQLDNSKFAFWPDDILWRKRKQIDLMHIKPNPLNSLQSSQMASDSLNHANVSLKKLDSLNHLQLFSFHRNYWIKETSFSANRSEFLKANLISKYGTTPIYIHNPKDDIHVSRFVLSTGSWESQFINILLDLLNQSPQHQFIDLGANIGVYSLSVAKFNRRVIAVEPLWKNVHRLGASIIDGQLTNLIQLVRSPLSDVYENVSFASEKNNIGGTFVIRDNSVTSGVNFTVVSNNVVETARLDDFLNLPNFDFKSVVMKIDVEGSEERTLRGGEEFFRRVDVVAVLMEWMHHKQDGRPIVDFMTRHGMYATIPTDPTVRQLDSGRFDLWPDDILWRKR